MTLDCDDSEMPCALTSVVRSSLNAILVVDETGRIVDFNAAAERAFAQSRAEMIGKSATDHIVQSPLHPEDRHRIRAFFTGRGPGESAVRGRIDWRGGGGALIPIEATITEVKLGGAGPAYRRFRTGRVGQMPFPPNSEQVSGPQ